MAQVRVIPLGPSVIRLQLLPPNPAARASPSELVTTVGGLPGS